MHKRLFLLCLFMPIIIGGCASAPRSARHNADSYCVAGHGCYRVVKSATGYTAEGQASWYGRGDAGKPTASGAPYDPRAMRIANKKLPFGTWVKIVNLDNHREAVAMVNDRGPFARNRIIDGTLAVAQRLGYYRAGTAPVRIIAIPETQLSQAQKEAARANKQHAIAYARSHKDHVWAEAGHVAVRGVVDVTKTGLKIGVGTAFAVLKTGGDIAFKTLTILL